MQSIEGIPRNTYPRFPPWLYPSSSPTSRLGGSCSWLKPGPRRAVVSLQAWENPPQQSTKCSSTSGRHQNHSSIQASTLMLIQDLIPTISSTCFPQIHHVSAKTLPGHVPWWRFDLRPEDPWLTPWPHRWCWTWTLRKVILPSGRHNTFDRNINLEVPMCTGKMTDKHGKSI